MVTRMAWRARCFGALLAVLVTAPVALANPAAADDVAYLVNVAVRPGYGFRDAADALTYGHGICEEIAEGRPYAQLIADVKAQRSTSDDYQGAYLVNQAANELCPALIWQLRQSAAHYRPTP
jgi:hypothetical protein